jgi:hypothetical protein
MRKVLRSEVVDYETYRESRPAVQARVLETKRVRRVHVGPNLTFLFENHDTVRYQIQEMMLAERIVKEADVVHEIETYNELLGADGELGATLLVEIPEASERARLLQQWRDLPFGLYARLEDGEVVRPAVDERQVGQQRLSSVQYLRFDTRWRTPVAIGCDHPDYTHEADLTEEQRAALALDLA